MIFMHKSGTLTYIVSRGEDKMEKQITKILPRKIKEMVLAERLDYRFLQEIRLRAGQPVTILYYGEEKMLPTDTRNSYRVSQEDIE